MFLRCTNQLMPSWRLQQSWDQTGIRPSATTTLILLWQQIITLQTYNITQHTHSITTMIETTFQGAREVSTPIFIGGICFSQTTFSAEVMIPVHGDMSTGLFHTKTISIRQCQVKPSGESFLLRITSLLGCCVISYDEYKAVLGGWVLAKWFGR